MNIKQTIKRIIPKSVLNLRHLYYAWAGAAKYNHPSEDLFVIGVTGTSGKSTTITLLRQLLEAAGYKVGSLSTIDFYIAGDHHLNDQKMTMLGKMQVQKFLREMVDTGCDIAIVETTSEGRVQHRHRFINYDTMLLTNLYPEHIDSHGSFENYQQAKIDIFEYVAKCKKKVLHGKKIDKTAIIKKGTKGIKRFLAPNFDKSMTFGNKGDFAAKDISVDRDGLHFAIHDYQFDPKMFGGFNVDNILGVIAVARSLDIPWKTIISAVNEFRNVPGRIEFIDEARERGFDVIVDYAFEPKAMKELYDVVHLLKPKRIIHVFGSTGGGRDVKRRFDLGKMIGKDADICIITDEDPYEDDPMEIINDVAGAAISVGKNEGKDLFRILDRREAVEKAVSFAKNGDLVLLTGKGSEQGMCIAGERIISWDDRNVVRDALKGL